MSEAIKHDLTLNLERKWFARIWNGQKTVEYRETKPYWTKRIGSWVGTRGKFVLFVLGYRHETPAVLAQVSKVDVGPCPYRGFDGEYYRIKFGIVGYYWKSGDLFMPFDPDKPIPKMKEKKVLNHNNNSKRKAS